MDISMQKFYMENKVKIEQIKATINNNNTKTYEDAIKALDVKYAELTLDKCIDIIVVARHLNKRDIFTIWHPLFDPCSKSGIYHNIKETGKELNNENKFDQLALTTYHWSIEGIDGMGGEDDDYFKNKKLSDEYWRDSLKNCLDYLGELDTSREYKYNDVICCLYHHFLRETDKLLEECDAQCAILTSNIKEINMNIANKKVLEKEIEMYETVNNEMLKTGEVIDC